MRLEIPLTGTVLVEGSVWGKGELTGDPADPIRPVPLNLGNVSWTMAAVDMKREVMIIEVAPGENVDEPDLDDQGVQRTKPETGEPKFKSRPATEAEKIGFLQYAQRLTLEHTRDELYQMSGCSRLKRPFKAKK